VRIRGTELTSPCRPQIDELADELVELRRAHDLHRDRAGEHRLLRVG
jgi:hypothetical protein